MCFLVHPLKRPKRNDSLVAMNFNNHCLLDCGLRQYKKIINQRGPHSLKMEQLKHDYSEYNLCVINLYNSMNL